MASQGIIVAIQFLSIPILTRLLDATDFGLVAMVTVFTGFSAMFVDAGLSMSTIQRDEITHQQVSNLFWLAAGFGLSISLIIVATGPLIAWFYSEPRLIPITSALAITPFLAGLTIQHQALLRRAMRLQQISLIQILAALISCILALAIAWLYRTYWALVVLTISAVAVRALGAWIACRWLPNFPRRGAGVRSMVGFGANLTGFNFVNYFARSGDNMLIGWWWGPELLGFYERAYKLMMAPLQQINAPLTNLMVPALSRVVDQPQKYRKAYFQAIAILQLVSCPIMVFVAVMAPQIVDVVFGRGFVKSGPILRWLAIAGIVQPLSHTLGWLYISQGRGQELMRWGMIGCSLIVLSFIAGLPWGPLGVSISYAAMVYVVIVPLAYWYAGAVGPVNAQDLWKLTLEGICRAALIAIPTMTIAYFGNHLSQTYQLFWAIIASTLAWGLLALFCTTGRQTLMFVLEQYRLMRKEKNPQQTTI